MLYRILFLVVESNYCPDRVKVIRFHYANKKFRASIRNRTRLTRLQGGRITIYALEAIAVYERIELSSLTWQAKILAVERIDLWAKYRIRTAFLHWKCSTLAVKLYLAFVGMIGFEPMRTILSGLLSTRLNYIPLFCSPTSIWTKLPKLKVWYIHQ